jgi:diazepam-binding inhibitor (GABA receptor modulating acyl-CoA-binding protein)
MEAKFNEAATKIKQAEGDIDNETLLQFYAYFKQATVGDVNTDAPGMFDLKGKAKWNAWKGIKGLSKEEAMQKYIDVTAKYIKN